MNDPMSNPMMTGVWTSPDSINWTEHTDPNEPIDDSLYVMRYGVLHWPRDREPRWTKVLDSGETLKEWQIVLPHRCDEWVIGGADAARTLAADLLRLAEDGPPAPLAGELVLTHTGRGGEETRLEGHATQWQAVYENVHSGLAWTDHFPPWAGYKCLVIEAFGYCSEVITLTDPAETQFVLTESHPSGFSRVFRGACSIRDFRLRPQGLAGYKWNATVTSSREVWVEELNKQRKETHDE